ncbi:hypothetical protein DDE19_29055 [Micromonospora ureilytica]|uniref:Integrase n=1 Tax=Micromonospora ureilytica TaxID=709868 RepID=A0A3N9XH05_9ACTN|nr:hypothetical protein DDE19_29055 [Micromonospora ureilytica]
MNTFLLSAHGQDQFARSSVEGYILHVLETRSAASACGRYRALRAFCNWAVREELIPKVATSTDSRSTLIQSMRSLTASA